MITRNLTRRLERLEAYLAPPSDEPAMVIRMTCVGHEDRIYRSARGQHCRSPATALVTAERTGTMEMTGGYR